ncbi:MAG: DUF4403 family protein [Bacteroidota bacterium]|nr:DUF4403 family protein [Bacteroidota bacterium]
MRALLLIVAVTAISFFGCNTIKPEKPLESYQKESFKPVSSTVNLPIEADIKQIENMVNNQIKGLIYNDDSFDNNDHDNLMVKAWKKEDISITLSGNQLNYRIPLKLWVKAGFKVTKLGVTLSNYKEIEGAIALKFKTKFSINKDWTVSTLTSADGFDWISSPVLKLGPVDVSVKTVATAILKSKQSVLCSEIDKQVAKNLDIKKYVQDAWNLMQKPINASDSLKLWIKLTPSEIMMTPILGSNGKIKTTVGIKSITETFLGAQPSAEINPNLPNLKVLNKMDDKFTINLSNTITYNRIEELTKKQVLGQTYKQGKYVVQVNDIKVYGSNDKLIVALDLLGSLKGKVYLSCKPVYVDSTMTIVMTDVDYELKTKNVLIKSADWLYHGGFLKMMTPYLKYSLKDKIEESKEMVQKALDNNQITKNITLKGNIDDLNIDNIYLTQDAIKVVVLAQGNLKILVNM